MDNLKVNIALLLGLFNGFMANIFGGFQILLYITLGAMLCDLITRCIAASLKENDRVESKKVLLGIKNKAAMCMIIVIALLFDTGLRLLVAQLGIVISTKILFTPFAMAWILTRELISNVENLADAGIPIPPFLAKALGLAKDAIENTGGSLTGGDNNE